MSIAEGVRTLLKSQPGMNTNLDSAISSLFDSAASDMSLSLYLFHGKGGNNTGLFHIAFAKLSEIIYVNLPSTLLTRS